MRGREKVSQGLRGKREEGGKDKEKGWGRGNSKRTGEMKEIGMGY